MPKRKPITFEALPVDDLAYAVNRLIASGKTTRAEILRLAAEREQRLAAVESELQALRGGSGTAAPARVTKGRRVRKVKAVARKPGAKKLNLTPKQIAFRKLQGLYAGYIRNFTGATRERIRAIAKKKGVAAAVAEMQKLRKRETPEAAAKRTVAKKLKISPARRAALRIHGTYIGLLRGLPPAEKAKMKALAKEKGMAAAVEVMRKGK